ASSAAAAAASAAAVAATTSLTDLVRDFDADGFIALSSLITPQFATKLRSECLGIFDGVLDWLFTAGETEFKASYRKNLAQEQTCSKYQYPLKVGLKNGYKELVMRSPGRYELALLVDDLPSNSDRMSGDGDADYDGKWLLSTKMLERGKEEQLEQKQSSIQPNENNTTTTNSSPCNQCEVFEKSCLKQLLGWVQNCTSSDGGNGNTHTHTQQYPIDQKNMERFMKLVSAIFPSSFSADGGCTSSDDQNTANSSRSSSGNDKRRKDGGYYLCNLSLVVATPGCPTQSWHADGGHTSLTRHEKCHVFNVFLPLVDVPLVAGPTELRPGTHYYTRNLAPMMLAAKARKTLRPAVAPEMRMGDVLLFDYRILHRGRANMNDEITTDVVDTNNNDEEICSKEEKGGEYVRHRPVLVLTFARRWFVDVCNFPKRSIFALDMGE
ncbi:hypothetical protein ACHAXR_012003, partial [Thalassiosira sp. AJA248-18]